MNGHEKTTLDVVANDVKWIKGILIEKFDKNEEDHSDIKTDIGEMKEKREASDKDVQKNTTFRRIGTWIVSVLVLTVIGFFVKIITGD